MGLFKKKKKEVEQPKRKRYRYGPNSCVSLKPAVIVDRGVGELEQHLHSKEFQAFLSITKFADNEDTESAFKAGFKYAINIFKNEVSRIEDILIPFMDFERQYPDEAKEINVLIDDN